MMFDYMVPAQDVSVGKRRRARSDAPYLPNMPRLILTRIPKQRRPSRGSTGHWPVPSGDPPLGTGKAPGIFRASVFSASVLSLPSGQWPDNNMLSICTERPLTPPLSTPGGEGGLWPGEGDLYYIESKLV